jgi:hypothetical protein
MSPAPFGEDRHLSRGAGLEDP